MGGHVSKVESGNDDTKGVKGGALDHFFDSTSRSDENRIKLNALPQIFHHAASVLKWEEFEFLQSVEELSSDIGADSLLDSKLKDEMLKLQDFLGCFSLEKYSKNFSDNKVIFSDLYFLDRMEFHSSIMVELIPNESDRKTFFDAIDELKKDDSEVSSYLVRIPSNRLLKEKLKKRGKSEGFRALEIDIEENTESSSCDSCGTNKKERIDSFRRGRDLKVMIPGSVISNSTENSNSPSSQSRSNSVLQNLGVPKLLLSPTSPRSKKKKMDLIHKQSMQYSVDPKCILLGDSIAKGAYGVVKRGIMRAGLFKVAVAVKEIVIDEKRTPMKDIESELVVQCELNHPNVVKCFGWYVVNNSAFIVMELCSLGDLNGFLRHHKDLDVSIRMNFLYQIAKAMSYLHGKEIIHRDLKPKNIFVRGTYPKFRLKIGDFGTSKHITDYRGTFCGTAEYLAPEQLDRFNTDKEGVKLVDVYSFGITMWEVLTGKRAFSELRKRKLNDNQILEEIHTKNLRPGDQDVIKKKYHSDLWELMSYCWDENPSLRPQDFDGIILELSEIWRQMKERKDIS